MKLPKHDLMATLLFGNHSFEAAIHQKPNLSNIENFNYHLSLTERSTADFLLLIMKYEEAIGILRCQFGNKQQIVNKRSKISNRVES